MNRLPWRGPRHRDSTWIQEIKLSLQDRFWCTCIPEVADEVVHWSVQVLPIWVPQFAFRHHSISEYPGQSCKARKKHLPTLLYHSHFSGSASYGLDVPLWRTSPTPTRRQRCNSSRIYKQVRYKIRPFAERRGKYTRTSMYRYFHSFLALSCKSKAFWCLIILGQYIIQTNHMYSIAFRKSVRLQWVSLSLSRSLFLSFRLAPSFDGSGRRSAPDVCKRSVARCAKDPSEKVWAELGKDDFIGYPRFDISG